MADEKVTPENASQSPDELHKGSGFAVQKAKWYIAECKPTKERVIRTMLQNDHYEVYVASQVEEKVYKSRNRRQVEKIVIPGKIFVRTENTMLMKILLTYSSIYRFILNRAASTDKNGLLPFAYVSDADMANLQYVLHHAPNPVYVTTDQLVLGQKVKVMRGPLAGYQGDFAQVGHSSCIVVKMEMGLHHYVYTEVPLEDIQLVNSTDDLPHA